MKIKAEESNWLKRVLNKIENVSDLNYITQNFPQMSLRDLMSGAGFKMGKLTDKLFNISLLHDEKRFHFDNFMSLCALWFISLEDFMPIRFRDSPKRKANWTKIYCAFVALLIYAPSVVRASLMWIWDSEAGLFWLHDVTAIIGGSRYYHIPMLHLWTIHTMLVIGQWWHLQFSGGDIIKKVVRPFLAVHYPDKASELGIKLSPMGLRLLRVRYNIGAICTVLLAIWGGLTAIAFCALMWANKFGIESLQNPWSIFMIFHSVVWASATPFQLFYQFVLQHVSCYMFGLQLTQNYRDIVALTPIVETKFGQKALKRLLKNYLDICCEVCQVNAFWKRFLGIAYFIYISTFTLLLFDVAFAPIPTLTKYMWAGIGLSQFQILCSMAYSGDIVSRRACKARVPLSSLCLKDLPLDLKIKIRKVIEISGSNRIEASDFRMTRQTKWIGFTVLDMFVVSDNDYVDIMVAVVTYLLLFIQLTY